MKRNGKWRVELGDAESGYLVRLDNCIDGFAKLRMKLENGLAKMSERKQSIEEELGKNENYAEQISEWQKTLRELDKELGTNEQ